MWLFERKFLNDSDIDKGPLNAFNTLYIWVFFMFLMVVSLCLTMPTSGVLFYIYLTIIPLFARLITLDLTHLVLPDIYTLPLLIFALILPFITHHITFIESFVGAFLGGGSLIVLSILIQKLKGIEGVGGGDIKMVAAAGAFLGVLNLPAYLWLASGLALLLYPLLRQPNKGISFGPTLIIALWILLLEPNALENLILFIM